MVENFSFQAVESSRNFSFSDNTTYGCGGPAKIAYYPKNEEEARLVFDSLKSSGEKFIVLGNGSNILAADGGYDGAVISTKKMKGIIETPKGCFVLAGTTVKALLNYCVMRGLGGVEYLAGIPATIGGLALMNGGAHSHYISENILSVSVYDGRKSEIDRKNCNFGYKYSTMRDINGIITGVLLDLSPQSNEVTRKKIESCLAARSSQPSGKSCGCVFKNPEGISAGKLIEQAGLKGCKIGGATVSKKHANFIINSGGTSADIYDLICYVKERVYSFSRVALEEEVVYIGDF